MTAKFQVLSRDPTGERIIDYHATFAEVEADKIDRAAAGHTEIVSLKINVFDYGSASSPTSAPGKTAFLIAQTGERAAHHAEIERLQAILVEITSERDEARRCNAILREQVIRLEATGFATE